MAYGQFYGLLYGVTGHEYYFLRDPSKTFRINDGREFELPGGMLVLEEEDFEPLGPGIDHAVLVALLDDPTTLWDDPDASDPNHVVSLGVGNPSIIFCKTESPASLVTQDA